MEVVLLLIIYMRKNLKNSVNESRKIQRIRNTYVIKSI